MRPAVEVALRRRHDGEGLHPGHLRGHDVHDHAAGVDRAPAGHVQADPVDGQPPLGDRAAGHDRRRDVGAALVHVHAPGPVDRLEQRGPHGRLEVVGGRCQPLDGHAQRRRPDAVELLRPAQHRSRALGADVADDGPDPLPRVGHVHGGARHDVTRVGVRTAKVDASDHATYLTLRTCLRRCRCSRSTPRSCPGLVLPLHIFEPRYREMVEELLARPDEDDREFGIVAVRDGRDVAADGMAALYPVGTADDPAPGRAARRRPVRHRHDRQPAVPAARGRRPASPSCARRWSTSTTSSDAADALLAEQVTRRFAAYRGALSGQVPDAVDADDPDDDAELPDDPTVLSYLVTAAMLLPTDERQSLLAAPTTGDRLVLARSLLGRETALISALSAVPSLDVPGRAPVGELVAARDPGTPATVALTRAGIAYTVHAYEHDPRATSFGLEAARGAGTRPGRGVQDAARHGRRPARGRHRPGERQPRPQGARGGGRRPAGGDGRPGDRPAADRLRARRHLAHRAEAAAADLRGRLGRGPATPSTSAAAGAGSTSAWRRPTCWPSPAAPTPPSAAPERS